MLASSPAAHAAPPDKDKKDKVVVGDLDQLSASELDLLNSSTPKVINVDAFTGDLTAVTVAPPETAEATTGTVTPFTAYPNGCTSTRGCWQYAGPSISGVGFSVGITNGSWPNVQNFKVGVGRYAKLCWAPAPLFPSTCMPERNGDNATIVLGFVVTGTKVDYQTYR